MWPVQCCPQALQWVAQSRGSGAFEAEWLATQQSGCRTGHRGTQGCFTGLDTWLGNGDQSSLCGERTRGALLSAGARERSIIISQIVSQAVFDPEAQPASDRDFQVLEINTVPILKISEGGVTSRKGGFR